MRMRGVVRHGGLLVMLAMMMSGSAAAQQGGAADPTARLAQVLPASAAKHIVALLKTARAEGLPGDALVNRSLKFAARGISPSAIASAADEQLVRMRSARDVLRSARRQAPSGGEIEAGAEALREGVRPGDVAALAQRAPAGRSVAIPLYVVGSLVNAGVPAQDALQRVTSKLQAHASDADIEATGRDAAASHRPADDGRRDGAGSGHSEGAGAPAHSSPRENHGDGPPATVPGANGRGHGHPGPPPGQANAPHGHGHGHP